MSQGQAGRPTKAVDLAQVSVPRLVFALLHQRFTGTLHVTQPGVQGPPRKVWFAGGMPVFTDWQEPTDMLGQILVGLRLIGDGELYAALQEAASTNQRLGDLLVAQGRLTDEQLGDALRRQCARKLSHIFALRDGIADVVAGPHTLGDGDGLVRLNVLELIQFAVGSYYDEARVATEMGPILEGPVRATAALRKYASHFRFRPSDADILDALTVGTDLASLAATPGITRRRAAQILYTLWACQMLHVGAAATEASGGVPVKTPTMPPRRATPTAVPPIVQGRPEPMPPPPAPARRGGTPTMPPVEDAPAPPPARARRATQPEVAAPLPTPVPMVPPASDDGTPATFEAELARYEAMLAASAHAFALFDLELQAGKREVRHAWGELSRKFHPDALQSRGLAHLRERVSAVFAALSEAQQILNDAASRDALREEIEKGDFGKPKSDENAKVRAAFEAELVAKEADKLLRANRYDRALERYLESAKLNAEEPDVQAAIVWCRFQLSGKTTDDHTLASAELARITTASPNTARAYYFRGFVLAGLGHDAIAIETFARAYALDSRLIDAERQARALRSRRTPQAPSQPNRAASEPCSGKNKRRGGRSFHLNKLDRCAPMNQRRPGVC